ncbi:Eukaryotic peptide chain release factor subunit 1 [Tritrichomonas foetus]|uniref:Eukaryotic peptide chain release factor subunit 1 n=1 Tax=Tritrichomonas foetus TaxID=1144522 RepID=A0A1J4KNS3_9EUKA|nr:Eukaryotic peptide chain release factor subunit 1 [Tritrichomonas foetus]|eukprot:OHT11444.1 Eukaryotic peptide chain release factor subunit 1 [Tritrichomonas foetus]
MSSILKVPANGICLFSGITSTNGKEKKVVIDFEPPKPLKSPLYVCDHRFHVDILASMSTKHEKYGYIIVGGQRCLLGYVMGDTSKILDAFHVEINKSQKKGGQSALRFQRIRDETRHNLIVRVSESAKRCFISNGTPNITGIILAGCAQLKNELQSSELLGDKLKGLVMAIFDVAYDGEQGFYEAIKMSRSFLQNVELIKEQQLLESLFDYAGKGGNCAFGVKEVMMAWNMNAIKELFISDHLNCIRYVNENEEVEYFPNGNYESPDNEQLIDWVISNYQKFGIILHIVGDSSPEGAQFIKGLGGIGTILRYPIDFNPINIHENNLDNDDEDDNNFDSDFDDF